MSGVQKRWNSPVPVAAAVDAALANHRPVERQILAGRSLTNPSEVAAFFRPEDGAAHDPLHLQGVAEAVDRIARARERGECVAVYGDYDVDGITATALLAGYLAECGITSIPYLPNRFDEGYGLRTEALATLRERGANLVVSVDCGIRSVKEVAGARSMGMDVIVTDHHQPGGELPATAATVCPRVAGGRYPFAGLAGVGIAFKVAEALARRLGRPAPEHLLELVAVGTIGDLAPLIDENRTLVARGLAHLNSADGGSRPLRCGLKALIAKAGLSEGKVTAEGVGFGLAPRLNAAGRLESPEQAYRLLTTTDPEEAERLAADLDRGNRLRQTLTGETVDRARALALAEGSAEALALLIGIDSSFSEGIVGLAAARLAEESYRPAIVGVKGRSLTRASARSIAEFHITDALEGCADLLVEYGGHAMAAGLTVRNEDWGALVSRLRQMAREALQGRDLAPCLDLDAEVSLEDVDPALLEFVERFEPCGEGNPRPLLGVMGAHVAGARAVGAQRKHLKLTLQAGRRTMDAIAFRQGEWVGRLPPTVDVAVHIERNMYLGVETLQLNVQDIRPSSWRRQAG